MRMEIQLKNIGQLLHFIERLNDRQKRALQMIIYSVDYSHKHESKQKHMPSWINGTGQQWLAYLNYQSKPAVQISPRINSWLDNLKPYFLSDYQSSINFKKIIDRIPALEHLKEQNPFLSILIASRIAADRDSSVRPFYHVLVSGLASLSNAHITSSDRARDLNQIYYSLVYLSRHFATVKIDSEIVERVINDIHQASYRSREFIRASDLNLVVTSLVARHTYSELNQMARAADWSFQQTTMAPQFISLFLEQLKSPKFNLERRLLPKLADNPVFQEAYQLARGHFTLIHSFLISLTKLNADNRFIWMKSVIKTLSRYPKFLKLLSLLRSKNIINNTTDMNSEKLNAADNSEITSVFHSLMSHGKVLFKALVTRLTSSRDTSCWRKLIRSVKKDLKAQNLLKFLELFLDQIKGWHGRITDLLNYYASLMVRFSDDRKLNKIYQELHRHYLVTGTVLEQMASLTRDNQAANLNKIAKTIQHSTINSIAVLHLVGNDAASMASQINNRRQTYLRASNDADEVFASLLNQDKDVSLLFNTIVNRLTAKTVMLTWREDIALIEYDFNNSRTFGLFIRRVFRLIVNYRGRITDIMKYFIQLMQKFSNNPRLNRAYQILKKHDEKVVHILEAVRTLNDANQYYNLNQIAEAANSPDFNSVSAMQFLASAASQRIPDSFRRAKSFHSLVSQNQTKLRSNTNHRYSFPSYASSISQSSQSSTIASNSRSDVSHLSDVVHRYQSGPKSQAFVNYSMVPSSVDTSKDNSVKSSSVHGLLTNINQWLNALNSEISKKN